MTDIMENLDTRELDIGDGEEEFDGQDPNRAGKRNNGINSLNNLYKIIYINCINNLLYRYVYR